MGEGERLTGSKGTERRERDDFTIAVLQKRARPRACEENANTVAEALAEAHTRGADLLLLPEAFLTGYQLPISNEEALAPSAPPVLRVREAAARHKVGVVVTAFTKGRLRPRNTAYLIDKRGNLVMTYDKVHTCDFSKERQLESGSAFRVCDFDGVKLGIMICYDREYPESARLLMLGGAEIILVPNDCTAMKPRLNALCTRAYENMTGVVMANPPGVNAGRSCAFSPVPWDKDGNCLEMCMLDVPETEAGLYTVTYDRKALRAYRASEMMGNTFRKVDAYSALLDPAVKEPFIR